MDAEVFGTTSDGKTVHRLRLSGGGLTAHVMTWGAVVQQLFLDGHEAPLVLGYERFDDYPAHSPYFGAIAGRYANRIRDGRFNLDGTVFEADRNFLGKHLLHGGAQGVGKRVWTIESWSESSVTLVLKDPDGTMGFPGTLDLRCTYRLHSPAVLGIEMTGETDRTTLCNLAHHSYFNLDDGGTSDCLDHRVTMAADAYLPVDDELIPSGIVEPVASTAFDFTKPRPVRMEEGGRQVVYDHNFCLSASRGPMRQAAGVLGARSGVAMEVWTTEPGLQFYAGHKLADNAPGLGGRRYGPHSGFCMEPQIWPDSPNRAYFPQAVLQPGETYRQITEYRFSKG